MEKRLETGRNEARGRHVYEMEEDQRDGRRLGVERVERTRGKVQKDSEEGMKGDYSRDKEGDGDHSNRQGEEFVVHVTSQGKQRWVDNCYCSVEFVNMI